MYRNRRLVGLSSGRAASLWIIGGLLCLSGCGGGDAADVAEQANLETAGNEEAATIFFANKEAPQSEGAEVDALRDAAEVLWTARVAADWATMYDFQRSSSREQTSREEYVEWADENIPFKWNSYELGGVHVHGLIGWVEVKQNVGMRKMAGIPPRETTVWERWMNEDGRWIPVASAAAENLPRVPVKRDLEEEAVLGDRFALSWQYRHGGDWDSLYDMTCSESRAATTKAQFREAQDMLIFVRCRVEWVEVVGDQGRVASFVQFKYNDPSMERMEPKTTIVIERWIREDGQWLLHNPRPTEEAEGAGQ